MSAEGVAAGVRLVCRGKGVLGLLTGLGKGPRSSVEEAARMRLGYGSAKQATRVAMDTCKVVLHVASVHALTVMLQSTSALLPLLSLLPVLPHLPPSPPPAPFFPFSPF